MRVVGGVGHEEPRLAAGRGHRPDIAARHEGDLASVGRDGGFGERGFGRGAGRRLTERDKDRDGEQEGAKHDRGLYINLSPVAARALHVRAATEFQ